MEKVVLKATIREKKNGKKTDKIPAVLYGKKLKNEILWVDFKEFNKAYEEAGESTLIDIRIEGDKEVHSALIYDIQTDPVTDEIIHADFYQVRMDEEVETEVEIVFIGESSAVKELGGTFVKNIDSVSVRCLPGDLPHELKVDISSIKTFDDYIYVSDLPLSEKVSVSLNPGTVVALVSAPRTKEEMEALDEEVDSDISKVEGMEEKGEEEGEGETPATETEEQKEQKEE